MDVVEMERRLREVVERGDAAQQAHARGLLEALATPPESTSALRHAELLVDAYLNDPYLTR
ncbi:MAG: hypothetical protein WAO50_00810 [Candidatus Nanopelagicales bacterium]|jgi:hypothetical protein|nr:DUF936 domain-containing protein [Candidatus Nanopelagicales bacterium]MCF8558159.1 DUF936 domain-containing protein [Candidatus Nanopelagicales bacterium]